MLVQAHKKVFVETIMAMFESPKYQDNDAVSTFLYKLLDYLGIDDIGDVNDKTRLNSLASRVFKQYENSCKSYYAFFDNVFMAEMVGMTYNKETLEDDLFKVALTQTKKPKEDSADDWSIFTAPILLSDHSYLFVGAKLTARDNTVLAESLKKFYKSQKVTVSDQIIIKLTEKLMKQFADKFLTLKRAAVSDQQKTYDTFLHTFLAEELLKVVQGNQPPQASNQATMQEADSRRMKRFVYLLSEKGASVSLTYNTKVINGLPYVLLPHPRERGKSLYLNVVSVVVVQDSTQEVVMQRKPYEAYNVFNALGGCLHDFYGQGSAEKAFTVAELFRKAIDLRTVIEVNGRKI